MAPEVFRRYVNSVFRLDSEVGQLDIQLVTVRDEDAGAPGRQMSLIFHGPANPVMPQGTYTVRHEVMDPLEMFLVPIAGSNDQRTIYQACFTVV